MTKNRTFRWLDRRIAAPGPYLTLVLSQEEYERAMRHCRIKHPGSWLKNSHAHATTNFLDNAKGELVAVVSLAEWKGRDPIEVAGLLVHEAVHVWQEYCSRIGEAAPASEQEAYGVQSIAQELLAEFARRMGMR